VDFFIFWAAIFLSLFCGIFCPFLDSWSFLFSFLFSGNGGLESWIGVDLRWS
jgi:hypothetical protein